MSGNCRFPSARLAPPVLLACLAGSSAALALDWRKPLGEVYTVSGTILSARCEFREDRSAKTPAQQVAGVLRQGQLDLTVRSDAGPVQFYYVRDLASCLKADRRVEALTQRASPFPAGARVELEVRASSPPDACTQGVDPHGSFTDSMKAVYRCRFSGVRRLSVDGQKVF